MRVQDDESLRRWKEQLLGTVDFESVGGLTFSYYISSCIFCSLKLEDFFHKIDEIYNPLISIVVILGRPLLER